MRKLFLLFLTILLSGCDAVYQYVVYPPPYIEYTLVPDMEMLRAANDTCYRISRDSTTLSYDKKDWKIEVKYMTDFQLNTYDFPDISTQKELAGNPYTYGNWVDPKLAYTPNRFLNMKMTIYNYSSSKINLNPEQSIAETDRGDVVVPYGIVRLKARYKSFEEYFQKLKGAAGSDEDLYETRMGVIRRTAFVLSRPLFAGDSRDGIVSYDPLDQSVERVKVTYSNVILGYDENNEPSRFATVAFYFKRVPMVRPKTPGAGVSAQKIAKKDTSAASAVLKELIKGSVNIRLLQSDFLLSARIDKRETKYWDPLPTAIPSLVDNLTRESGVKAGMAIGRPEKSFLDDANIIMVAAGTELPVFSDAMIQSIADAIRNKSFLFVDDGSSVKERTYSYENFMREFLVKVGKVVDPSARVDVVPLSHSLYGNLIVPGTPPKKSSHTLVGLFVKGELVAVGSVNSLYQQWDEGTETTPEQRDESFRIGRNILIYGGSKKFSSQNGTGR